MSRILLASARLPSNAVSESTPTGPASGGNAAATLRPWFDRSDAWWVGWPGGSAADRDPEQRGARDRALAEARMTAVDLDGTEVDRFVHGFSNRLLWPLFHYLLDRVPVDAHGWQAYQAVNARFADAVVAQFRAGDRIWVHDYHLLLLPSLLRGRLPQARIGFFFHVPFPSSEVFRTLPWRSELINGVLGADLIGFQTFAHLRHFFSSILHIENIEMDIDRVRIDGRDVRLGVFPMGVDAAAIGVAAEATAVTDAVTMIRRDSGGRSLGLALDALDYTTGIPRRLEALERLMHRRPECRDRLRVFQVAVPLAEESDARRRLRREVEERVGRINGAYSTVRSVPVHYVHQDLATTQVLSLYRAADLMFVTPLRDGMSLIAKEFVAARSDEDGVLLLSEFAGAADELDGALMVNPYDVEGTATTIAHALTMLLDERRERMRTLRRRVTTWDVHTWAARFLDSLGAATAARPSPTEGASTDLLRALAVAREGEIRLLLDYDGTLVPLAHLPELAAPDPALLELLERLLQLDGLRIDIVSGRSRESLEAWFGHLPLTLWAEHGFWWRLDPGQPWACGIELQAGWLDRIRPILDQFTAYTPGSLIEVKTASIAWHYRNAPEVFGARQAHELRLLLTAALSNQPFEVLEGKRVIEVRLRGASKAVVARSLRSRTGTMIAFGDDRTDEDLFRALPPGSITVGVGERPTRARFTARDFVEVRRILHALTRMRRGQVPADAGQAPA